MSPGAPLDGRVDVPAGCPYDVAPLDGHPDRLDRRDDRRELLLLCEGQWST